MNVMNTRTLATIPELYVSYENAQNIKLQAAELTS
jgi:hypothetical protein